MAKLYFTYGTMNSGKSRSLVSTAYNYHELFEKRLHDKNQHLQYLIYTTSLDTRSSKCSVESRDGSKLKARYVTDNIYEEFAQAYNETKVEAVFIDEAQFLTKNQVDLLTNIVDDYDVSVFCYGLKTDFSGKLFAGSEALLSLADTISESKTLCTECMKRKAILNGRFDKNNNLELIGDIIQTGYNYRALCRRCYKKLVKQTLNSHAGI